MSTIGPSTVHDALNGLSFPTTKEQILAHLDDSEAAGLVRSKLEDIPDGEYNDIDEVDQALGDESY